MLNKKFLPFYILAVLLIFSACRTSVKEKKETKVILSNSLTTVDIPFTIAENYFSTSNHSVPSVVEVRSQEELEQHLGMAATMGPNGKPTAIDFNQSFAIVVTEPKSKFLKIFNPVSLIADSTGQMKFTYEVVKGEEQSYETKPVLTIIVSNENQGKISYDRIEK